MRRDWAGKRTEDGPVLSESGMDVILALDTSNYTTSVAAADLGGTILEDRRRILEVEKGKRGLRQSQALFLHTVHLPDLIEDVCQQLRTKKCRIRAVAVSDKPRPVEGSYMPCFLAGITAGRAAASTLGVPFYTFSHQEGHIAAAGGIFPEESERIAFHLSGGTGELVKVTGNMPGIIVGGIRDISFGQLLDRVGVAAGLEFPAGAEMDRLAGDYRAEIRWHLSRTGRRVMENGCLKPIFVEGCEADLSGIETECLRALDRGQPIGLLSAELFLHITDALAKLSKAACESQGIEEILFVGGVASSRCIRRELSPILENSGIRVSFGEPGLSSDNACGTARLGVDRYVKELEGKKFIH